jgi:DNA-binding transcriptional LysR family regulator
MDRLRAIEYLVAAADERSFSGAARRLGVSQPAVQKLVTALERRLGVPLFERRSTGLAITADGADYVSRCRGLLEALREADERVTARDLPRGPVVVGATTAIAHDWLGPGLPAFHRRFPSIELEFRFVQRLTDPAAEGVDVYLMHGWQEHPDLVRVPIGHTRYAVVATREYWAAHGMPSRPAELARHAALLYRSGRTLLDRWRFQRGAEVEAVEMRGWLSSTQREVILQAALAGTGVARLIEPPRVSGLVEVLRDWTALEAPPVQILYRAEHRSTVRVRRFVEFAAGALRGMLPEAGGPASEAPRPDWWDRRARSSASAGAERRAAPRR